MSDIEISVGRDGITPLLRDMERIARDPEIRAGAMNACVNLTRNYLLSMGSNRMGWPSTGFYRKCAEGTVGELSEDGFHILIDNPDAPGALKFRWLCHIHGTGTIEMKDKLLTIPARSEFYGHRATEFDNLRYVKFAGGAQALVVGQGGTGRLDAQAGRVLRFKGGGARQEAMVAYWLVQSVTQGQSKSPVPKPEDYIAVVKNIYLAAYMQLMKG